jgi:quercetin dioxygenase-like cupin family protein
MAGKNVAEMQFVPIPGMPTCASGSVTSGDPGKGPSFIMARMAAGCVFPWHWHTPNEHLMIVTGTATAEMKDAKPVKLEAGAFALMPSNHVHRFSCSTACSLYVYSDAAFDMHYVDAAGKEIAPDIALRAVGETVVPQPIVN